jgi:tetratricopeptide (TPR) repeat protein
MYNKNIKLVIAGLIIAWAVFQFSQGNIWSGIFILLLSGIFILLYYKNEFLLMSFLRMRKQDFAGAEKWLNKIKNPESALVKKQQGYYNFLKGIMTSQRNLTQAEKYFRKAVNLGMSMDHDLAMAKLQLAGIAMAKRRKREATMLMNEAKKLDKHGMLKDQLAQLKQQMKRM